MVVTKLATQRPKLPSVGRLGLVDPPAGERLAQLGWDRHEDQAHVDLLWSLSRAPDADAALRALIRLSENPDTGWDELNAALLRERSLRGRLFSVLGSSLALGDHLVAHPQSWKLLRARSHCRPMTSCSGRSSSASRNRRVCRARSCTDCEPSTATTC
ncbi:glutamate-ammonia-ligase adenylyltransferase [Mycobacterium tuberculosis variant africanum]|nr:glutamate-ammonia-ligase adenylyltransferase [Mycobacterium tuberculosis variant africanum]